MTDSRANSTPELIASANELRRQLDSARRDGKTIGLVPTMGALHEGHLSLLDAARRECDFTVVTIFVNPTQFGPGEDFSRYPRKLDADLELLASRGADLVFAPATDDMYGPRDATFVDVGGPACPFEGEHRPGHFRGVATIVLKLFNLVAPNRAYFGRKDFQQSLVVRRMVEDLNLPIQIEVCPTLREADGLAMSSRNAYLSDDERRRALAISQGLRLTSELIEKGMIDVQALIARMREPLIGAGLKIDYVAIVDRDTLQPLSTVDRPAVALVAARVGATRLIDNELLG